MKLIKILYGTGSRLKMKIKFDYKDVESETVAEVLELLMKKLNNFRVLDEETSEDKHSGRSFDFGEISLYLTVIDKESGKKVSISNPNGKEIEWTVKQEKMPRSKKQQVTSNEKYTVYTS